MRMPDCFLFLSIVKKMHKDRKRYKMSWQEFKTGRDVLVRYGYNKAINIDVVLALDSVIQNEGSNVKNQYLRLKG